MHQLLQSMGVVEEYEPRVVNQLLDFMYRYTTDILLDAEAYSEHAGKPAGQVEMDDVMLAIESRAAYSFVQPAPGGDALHDLALQINSKEMPKFPSAKHGLLLPEESITAQNFQLQLQPQ